MCQKELGIFFATTEKSEHNNNNISTRASKQWTDAVRQYRLIQANSFRFNYIRKSS